MSASSSASAIGIGALRDVRDLAQDDRHAGKRAQRAQRSSPAACMQFLEGFETMRRGDCGKIVLDWTG